MNDKKNIGTRVNIGDVKQHPGCNFLNYLNLEKNKFIFDQIGELTFSLTEVNNKVLLSLNI